MTREAFSSISPRAPVALIDLVETLAPEASGAFMAQVAPLAREVGGQAVLVNDAITPMIVPDGTAEESDREIRLLVVTHFPAKQAAELYLAKRQESNPELSGDRVRTYAAQPVGRIESFVGRALPYTLGLGGRKPVPKSDETRKIEALIDDALILGEQPDKSRWVELIGRTGDQPIWMLNFLEFEKTAVYADDAQGAAKAAPISGARAYQNYGRGMVSSLGAVGGRVGWSGRTLGQLAGKDDGKWHQVAIAVYPSAAAMMTMLTQAKYQAAHVHRAAALARTRLLATQPA